MDIGRGLGYDSLKDQYTTIAKDKKTKKIVEFIADGKSIAQLIYVTRKLAGEMMNQESAQRFVRQAV